MDHTQPKILRNKSVDRAESSESDEAGDVVQLDNHLLEEIGYRQEFKREFTRLSTLSYAISIMGVLGSVPATYTVPLSSAGPAAPIWCWFIGTFMSLTIGLSVAELCSSYPTAGGMYVVTKYVVADKAKMPLAAWIIGWANFLGQTAGVASVAYSVGQFILAMASLGSGFDAEADSFRYSPTAEHTVAASVGMLVLMGIICSLPSRWLSDFIVWFAPVNILASVAIATAMLVMTENKNSPSYVFTNVVDGSGWGNRGFSFLLGFLSVVWTMTDYDAVAHLAEETRNAAVRGPVAIGEAIVVSGVFGLLLNITFGFCIGDGTAALESTTGHPIAQIMYNAAGQAGGLGMFFWVFLIQFFTGTSAMLSDTRQAFAFARDHALPFSSTLKKINPYTKTPLYSVWLVVAFCCCLNLIALGSVQTIQSIFAVTAPALDLSYIAVIILRLLNEDKIKIREGPFSLGKYSKPINYIAIAWTFFITVILFFPQIRPVTALNMNYAVVVATFIIIFATSWWYIHARKVYIGPRTDDNLTPEEPQDVSKS